MQILFVDDDKESSSVVVYGLGREGYSVDLVLPDQLPHELPAQKNYNIAIVNLDLATGAVQQICARLKASNPRLLILWLVNPVLLPPAEGGRAEGLLEMVGADEYLVKPFSFGRLSATVHRLWRTAFFKTEQDGPVLRYGDLKLDLLKRVAWQGERKLELFNREFEVLEYLVRHPGRIISHVELGEQVWKKELKPMSVTVYTHINSLRTKLGDKYGSPVYIETIARQGYKLGVSPIFNHLDKAEPGQNDLAAPLSSPDEPAPDQPRPRRKTARRKRLLNIEN